MTTSRQQLGKRGEDTAAQYLLQHNYTIIARNWHCKWGELDIIAQQQAVIVFVEVKTRYGDTPINPFENITPAKRKRLIASVYAYLQAHPLTEVVWRIDAVGIALPRSGQPIIEHVEDALDW